MYASPSTSIMCVARTLSYDPTSAPQASPHLLAGSPSDACGFATPTVYFSDSASIKSVRMPLPSGSPASAGSWPWPTTALPRGNILVATSDTLTISVCIATVVQEVDTFGTTQLSYVAASTVTLAVAALGGQTDSTALSIAALVATGPTAAVLATNMGSLVSIDISYSGSTNVPTGVSLASRVHLDTEIVPNSLSVAALGTSGNFAATYVTASLSSVSVKTVVATLSSTGDVLNILASITALQGISSILATVDTATVALSDTLYTIGYNEAVGSSAAGDQYFNSYWLRAALYNAGGITLGATSALFFNDYAVLSFTPQTASSSSSFAAVYRLCPKNEAFAVECPGAYLFFVTATVNTITLALTMPVPAIVRTANPITISSLSVVDLAPLYRNLYAVVARTALPDGTTAVELFTVNTVGTSAGALYPAPVVGPAVSLSLAGPLFAFDVIAFSDNLWVDGASSQPVQWTSFLSLAWMTEAHAPIDTVGLAILSPSQATYSCGTGGLAYEQANALPFCVCPASLANIAHTTACTPVACTPACTGIHVCDYTGVCVAEPSPPRHHSSDDDDTNSSSKGLVIVIVALALVIVAFLGVALVLIVRRRNTRSSRGGVLLNNVVEDPGESAVQYQSYS